MEYVTRQEIEQRMPWVLDTPADHGRVAMIVVRPDTNQRKILRQAHLSPEHGVAGDNWQHDCWKTLANGQADPEVQVAIMNSRMIEVLTRDQSRWPLAGDQLFVDFDLSLSNLAAGQQLQIGQARLQITAEPHRGCKKFKQRFGPDALDHVNSALGDAHRLRGVYARIIQPGTVEIDDVISKC